MLFCNLNFIKIPPSLFANLSELTAFSLVMANVLVITYALGNNGNRKKYLKYEFRELQKLKNEKTYLFYCTSIACNSSVTAEERSVDKRTVYNFKIHHMHSKWVAWVIQTWPCLTINEECGTRKCWKNEKWIEKWEVTTRRFFKCLWQPTKLTRFSTVVLWKSFMCAAWITYGALWKG